jgi:hypothetical protein
VPENFSDEKRKKMIEKPKYRKESHYYLSLYPFFENYFESILFFHSGLEYYFKDALRY